jgi:hypothetical protein
MEIYIVSFMPPMLNPAEENFFNLLDKTWGKPKNSSGCGSKRKILEDDSLLGYSANDGGSTNL